MNADQHAESDREQWRLFRTYVTGDGEATDWFNPPEEGRLVNVQWIGSDAWLTWVLVKYPALIDGEV